jgi:murein DD-endopeptidase MepM/ murein hydrolase activator NlpD
LPDSQGPLRRVLHARPLARAITHLLVLALLATTAAVAISVARSTGPPSIAGGGGRGLLAFDLIASARAAALAREARSPVTYELAGGPDRSRLLERDPAPEPPEATPLPTPVAPATPQPVAQVQQVQAIAATQPPVITGTSLLAWPVPGGTITQYFSSAHPALDIAAPTGSAVIAAGDGVVTFAGWRNNGGGLVIAIDHGNGIQTVYNHLGVAQVAVGTAVSRGQLIASVGCTGLCTGPHVHFEVLVGGYFVNPLRYL